MKIAIVFPGQGNQYPGMGKDWYDNMVVAKEFYSKLPKELVELSFYGTKDDIKKTENCQPITYAFNHMTYKTLNDWFSIPFDITAGDSLGEYNSLCIDDVYNFEKGLELVIERGKCMGKKQFDTPNLLIAFHKDKDISNLVKTMYDKGIKVYISGNKGKNLEKGTYITNIAGLSTHIKTARKELKKEGIKSLLWKETSAPFHTPLLKEAAEEYKKYLDNFEINKPSKTLSNFSGTYHKGKIQLPAQIVNPVQLTECFKEIYKVIGEDGLLLELGPGNSVSSKYPYPVKYKINIDKYEDIHKLENILY